VRLRPHHCRLEAVASTEGTVMTDQIVDAAMAQGQYRDALRTHAFQWTMAAVSRLSPDARKL
jgi:hypothetical protein